MSAVSPHVHFNDNAAMVFVKGDFLQNYREENSSLKYNFGVLRISSNQDIQLHSVLFLILSSMLIFLVQ